MGKKLNWKTLKWFQILCKSIFLHFTNSTVFLARERALGKPIHEPLAYRQVSIQKMIETYLQKNPQALSSSQSPAQRQGSGQSDYLKSIFKTHQAKCGDTREGGQRGKEELSNALAAVRKRKAAAKQWAPSPLCVIKPVQETKNYL